MSGRERFTEQCVVHLNRLRCLIPLLPPKHYLADLHPRVDVGNVLLCRVNPVAQVIHHPVLDLKLLLDVLGHLPESVHVLFDNGEVLVLHLLLAVADLADGIESRSTSPSHNQHTTFCANKK